MNKIALAEGLGLLAGASILGGFVVATEVDNPEASLSAEITNNRIYGADPRIAMGEIIFGLMSIPVGALGVMRLKDSRKSGNSEPEA